MTIQANSKAHHYQHLLFICCTGLLFLSLIPLKSFFKKPTLQLNPQQQIININEKFIKTFDLGLHRLLSSSLWVETFLKGDIEHYNENKLESWMFLRFNTITHLDPKFYQAYLFGSIYLSIVKDDLIGASYLYDKGLKQFPNDFHLNLNAAFHYYFETGNVEKSLPLMEKVAKDPRAPAHYPSLIARIKSEKGNLKVAFSIISDLYQSAPEGSSIKKAHYKNLYAIKAEIDLTCLNDPKQSACSPSDLDGNSYIKKHNEFQAPKEWTPFRVKNKKGPAKKRGQ